MKRIYDFSSFSKLYEAEEGGEKKISDFQNLIQMALANILDCYKRQTGMTKEPYDKKIMGDYDAVINAPGVDSLKKILDNVKSSAADDAKSTGEAWRKAADAFLGVLSKIYELMPNNKEAIGKIVSDYVKTAKEKLGEASQDNEAKKAAEEAEKEAKADNNSLEYLEGEGIFEALDFLKGKKGKLKDLSKQITIVGSTLNDFQEIDFLKDEAAKQKSELDKISSEVVKMFGMKNRDIENDDLERLATQMSEIVAKLADKQKELASQNETTKEAALLFAKATQELANATKADSEYQAQKILKKKEEEIKKKKEDEKAAEGEADKKFEEKKKDFGDLKKPVKSSEVKDKKNEQVAKVQTLIKDKLGKKIDRNSSEEFDKFTTGKYAGDGYFGKNTETIIKATKAALGMDDESSDITEELVDRLLSLKESESFNFGRIKSFGSFETLNEGRIKDVKFDSDVFLKVTKGEKVEKKEKAPDIEKILDLLTKQEEDSKEEFSDVFELVLDKDFEPTDKGKEAFEKMFGISWEDFKKSNDDQKKSILKSGLSNLSSTLKGAGGMKDIKIDKELISSYLKTK